MIITQTPFRMSFFGGGTDMESFFRENGGAVLSTTFDKYCYVNVRHLPRFFDYSTELSYSKTERVTCIEDIQHPAIRNAMKMLDIDHEINSSGPSTSHGGGVAPGRRTPRREPRAPGAPNKNNSKSSSLKGKKWTLEKNFAKPCK